MKLIICTILLIASSSVIAHQQKKTLKMAAQAAEFIGVVRIELVKPHPAKKHVSIAYFSTLDAWKGKSPGHYEFSTIRTKRCNKINRYTTAGAEMVIFTHRPFVHYRTNTSHRLLYHEKGLMPVVTRDEDQFAEIRLIDIPREAKTTIASVHDGLLYELIELHELEKLTIFRANMAPLAAAPYLGPSLKEMGIRN